MKTFNAFKFRAMRRKLGLMLVASALMASCGSNSNDSKSSTSSTPVTTTTTTGTGTIPYDPTYGGSSNLGQEWSNLKSSMNCSQGRMADLSFTASSANGYGPYGPLQTGAVSGSSQGSYFGKNCNGDLILVNKVVTGSALAYNVVVSFCTFNDGYYEYIGPNAGMNNFTITSPLQLTNNNYNVVGQVMSGTIAFNSQNYPRGPVAIQWQGIDSSCGY